MERFSATAALVLGLAAFLLAGCTKTPEGGMLGHVESVVGILEANADSPDEAARAVAEYTSANQADLDALRSELHGLDESLSDEQKKERGEALKTKADAATARLVKLFEEHPQLAIHERVNDALKGLFPIPR